MRGLFPFAALALFLVTWRAPERVPGPPLAPDRPIASLVPARCALFVDAGGLVPLAAQGLEHPFVRALRASPLGAAAETALPASVEELLGRADAWLGADARATLAALAERGLALGLVPGSEPLLVLHGSDDASTEAALATALAALERTFARPGALAYARERWGDAEVWNLGDTRLARRGALVLLGKDEGLVREALALAADPAGRGLLERAELEALAARRPEDSTLWAWVDAEAFAPVADEGFRALRAADRTPPAQALAGARLAALVGARCGSLSLTLDARGLVLGLEAEEARGAAPLLPGARAGAVPAAPTGPALASALVYRDYGRFVGERAALFPPEALPGFAEALTNGALFFEGRDLGTEVLDDLSPWIRLVARLPRFEPGRAPEIPLPAAAAVAVLEDEAAGERWLSAFQSLVAVIGVQRAQEGGASLRLVVDREGAAEISSARFGTPPAGAPVELRYNLEPALAVVGRHLVLGTHASLVRALARELEGRAPEPAPAPTPPESLAVELAGLRPVLAASAAHLVARRRLTRGESEAEARRAVDAFQAALDTVARLELGVAADDPARPRAWLALRFEAPGEEAR